MYPVCCGPNGNHHESNPCLLVAVLWEAELDIELLDSHGTAGDGGREGIKDA